MILLACSLGMYADGIQCLRNYSFCWRFSLNNWCWGKIFCVKIYWTQAKMLLLADVDEYSFENAGICIIDILTYSEPDFWLHLHNIRWPLCGHRDLFLAVRNYLHLLQRLASIVEWSVVIIQLLWGQKWILVFCCGTFLFVLIIKFKLFSTIVTDVEPMLGWSCRATSTQSRSDVGLTMYGQ